MITLPNGLNAFMKGQKLDGLKPFALLFRNKWDRVNNKYALEDTPIDISALIAKPNTLSMTLDVNEVAQYNANNVTLTLSDTKNYFVEGTPNSYFPEGYQIYGSRVVLYYGTDSTNRTPLFAGVIKDLPTYKPEKYQVELKLVSPLEMLKDIEAKDFSDKYYGETLTYVEDDSDGHKIYQTTGTGVGGFNGVYADGNKLFEGVDYEVEQTNALGLPAKVIIINSDHYSATITADYYTWKTGLTVEQIVAGLVGLAGYDTGTEDIRNVVWNTEVKTQYSENVAIGICYYKDGNDYKYYYESRDNGLTDLRGITLQGDFKVGFSFQNTLFVYIIGDSIAREHGTTGFYQPTNGIRIMADGITGKVNVSYFQNGSLVDNRQPFNAAWNTLFSVEITRENTSLTISISDGVTTSSISYNAAFQFDKELINRYRDGDVVFENYAVKSFKNGVFCGKVSNDKEILFELLDLNTQTTLSDFGCTLSSQGSYSLFYRYGNNPSTLSEWTATSIHAPIGVVGQYFQFLLQINDNNIDISDVFASFMSSSLTIQFVNLTGRTVLEALQDLALISGYEFGVDRQGVFFFRPRVSSTTPTYILDHNEIVKVDTVKKNLSDFFTKLTLTFAQVPLEFYANTGERPTLVDKYGIINKEIDKPDIVNYDNPELAQAIGPQLLEVYSSLSNIIQATGKLNLALELGDIVQLDRNYPLVEPENASDYTKFENQQTYYRACKVIGMNYNFEKKQITYTFRDVSNSNNTPAKLDQDAYIYEIPVDLG